MSHPVLQKIHSPAIAAMADSVKTKAPLALCGMTQQQAAMLCALLQSEGEHRVLMLLPNDIRAQRMADDLMQLQGSGVMALPGGEIDLTRGASSHESASRRLETLTRILQGRVNTLCLSPDSLMQRMTQRQVFEEAMLCLHPGDRFLPDKLVETLVRMGYERVSMVEGKGQCAMRGAILDVYPPAESTAVRIEFFDDEIDSLRILDPATQRSRDRLEECVLSPASEVLIPEERKGLWAQRMKDALDTLEIARTQNSSLLEELGPLPEDDDDAEAFDKAVAPKVRKLSDSIAREDAMLRRRDALLHEADTVAEGLPIRRGRAWLSVMDENTVPVTEWFQPDVVFLVEPEGITTRIRERMQGYAEELESAMERGEAVQAQQNLLMGWEELLPYVKKCACITCQDLLRTQAMLDPQKVCNLDSTPLSGYGSQMRALASDLETWRSKGMEIVILSGSAARGKRLQETLAENHVNAFYSEDKLTDAITICPETLSGGFVWPESSLAVVTDSDIWGAGLRKTKSRRTTGEKIAAFTDLKVGDYIVHEDHGVGIYQGTVKMQSDGATREYLLLQYHGTDKLYVPVESLQRVQRYIGNPQQPPKLSRIGSSEWKNQKSKVKEGLKKLAFDLVQLYARREQQKGYAFSPNTPWQREFEDQFPYELTPDQRTSVNEIYQDMESDRSMDRLLCGDVGYGKTEVSLRAAFKAVMDSRQVAILAPTTILAQQHYVTCVKRFSAFPVRIEVISRLKSTKEQKDILRRLAEGEIDILIGTHRVLAKDVHFKNLGLLIVDEEQRFGVGHKEQIKNLKSQVDVLTLSATPIPRTLNMSMIGIRDMSVLETPPEERLPVATRVVEYSDALVRDAILRELSRGGQIYFLYNRVGSIEKFYQRLRTLVPEARIGVAHGQMKEHALEDVMMDFYGGSYDVLLCTTIIESGLDVPTANTLIVYDAERFGLSQLYQLRGRVGRSNRQAYAFFTIRPDKAVSETAAKRLQAIREFTEFGSGFRIAMRDLEIRGAGNLLGAEQHGHLSQVGYEMYCKLVEETLLEAQGKETEPQLNTRIDLKVDAYIPDNYIRDEKQRMEMYRRIADVHSEAMREDIVDELIDRFGDVPRVVDMLLDVSYLRYLCAGIGIAQVIRRSDSLVFRLEESFVKDPLKLVQVMEKTDSRLQLTRTQPAAIALRGVGTDEKKLLHEALELMKRISEGIHANG